MGTVYLIGAGPGDPGLLTLRGARLLSDSDAVVYDALANDELLAMAPAGAARFDVGKRAGGRGPTQEAIDRLLAELAREHEVVVRLKGGDPCVFGRGGEEALALREAGVPFEIVPGVTAGLGALAYAGIPVTHRGVSSSVTFVTGHRAAGAEEGARGRAERARANEEGGETQGPDSRDGGVDWDALARVGGTVVVYMGLSKIDAVVERLTSGGRSPETPAAVIESGTYPDQRTIVGDLASIAELSRAADAGRPALIVVGEVVRLSGAIDWFRRAAVAHAAGEGGIPQEAGIRSLESVPA